MPVPQFNTIAISGIPTQLQNLLQENLQQLQRYIDQQPIVWEKFIPLLEQGEDRLHRFWSPIQHLHAVRSTPELRAVYQDCLPLLTAYETALGHHAGLYQAFCTLDAQSQHLNAVQRRIIALRLRDFHLSGIGLSAESKQRYTEIEQQLAKLTTAFGEHVLDATQGWHYLSNDANELAGLPEHVLETAKNAAQHYQQSGWRLTLQYPYYSAIQKYAESRTLREICYRAYVTRASEFGAPDLDNTSLMQQILQLRQELAELLGFPHYAALSLATKMADTPTQVLQFLQDLTAPAKSAAQRELNELADFAGHPLDPWDIAFYSEKLRQQRYHLQEEQLRRYFPLPQVLNGLFHLMTTVFGLSIRPFKAPDVWHPDVQCFAIYDRQQQLRGIFYLDAYVREQKREGAWMDDYCSRWRKPDGELQYPVAYLTCNFAHPQPEQPALLTHDDVITLFHEFGHGLQHLLTTVDYLDVAGIHNVAWDAVELPSQFMENWCWQPEVLRMLSSHYQTGEKLPEAMLTSLLASRHFHAGLQLVRQLEFALFDFQLHLQKPEGTNFVRNILAQIREQVSVIKAPDYNRFPQTFTHIFDGGYAAGYYSYLWAEGLASDAFALFEEQGIFNQAIGQRFMDTILAQGGSVPAGALFQQFRGRALDSKALLHAWGLA